MSETGRGLVGRLSRYSLVIILLVAFAGVATYSVMSDSSIHGLTVRFYNATWYCSPTDSNHPNPILNYKFGSVVVYSSASLTTSLSHVSFSMSTNGFQVGTVQASDSSFSPGQSALYSLIFNNTQLDPHSQPLLSIITLTVNAQVSAGVYSSPSSASDSESVHFPSPPC